MAATITLGSLVLAADGKTLTGTLGGGSGTGYTPASAITNVTLWSGTASWFQASSAISGSTLTIVLNTFVPTGTTLTVSVGTGNLTDSAANTAAVVTGTAVTNNSTQTQTTFADSNTNVYFLGQVGVTGNYASRSFRSLSSPANGDTVETILTGTDASVLVLGGQSDVVIVIDGGAPVTYLAGALTGNWVWVKLFSGLTDTTHTVKISTGYFDRTTLFAAKGAAPAATSPAGYSQLQAITSAPFSTYSALDGPVALIPGSGHSTSVAFYGSGTVTNGSIRFSAAVTDIWIFAYQPTYRWVLYQNGIEVGNTYLATSNAWGLLHLASSLGNVNAEYEILQCDNAGAAYGIMLTGTGLTAKTYTSKDVWAFYGDSITASMTGLTPPLDARQTDMWQLGRSGGATIVRAGAYGQLTSTYGRDNTAQVTGLPVAPKKVFVRFGTNDMGNHIALATFKADYKTMLTNLRSGLPSAEIWACGLMPRNNTFTPTLIQYNAQIIAGVAELADPNTRYLSMDNAFDPTVAANAGDGLHPSALGYKGAFAVQVGQVMPGAISAMSFG